MADNVNDRGDSRTIQEIVRAVVANLSALPNSAGLPPRATLSGSSAFKFHEDSRLNVEAFSIISMLKKTTAYVRTRENLLLLAKGNLQL